MPAIAKDLLPAIVERLKAGGSSLGVEARALGMTYRTTLITTLRDFMGRAAYDEMIASSGRRPGVRVVGADGVAVMKPALDDSKVKTLDGSKLRWVMAARIHEHIVERYHDLGTRLEGNLTDEDLSPELARTVRLSMESTRKSMEADVFVERKGAWSTDTLFEPIVVETDDGKMLWRKKVADLFIAPDGTQYVRARTNEGADLVISRKVGEALRLRLYETSSVAKAAKKEEALVERGKAAKAERKSKKEKAAKAATPEPEPTPAKAPKKKGRTKAVSVKKGKAKKSAKGKSTKGK